MERPLIPVGERFVYVCQARKCTRFMVPWQPDAYPYEEQNRWLIAPHRLDHQVLVVRCPQHIDHHVLDATIGRSSRTLRWAAQVRGEDAPTHEAWSPLTPYPLDPKLVWSADGNLAFDPSRRRRRRRSNARH